MLVEYLPAGGAIIATLDSIKGVGEHTYAWQANVGSPTGDDGIAVTAGTEAGRPTFLMKGANDAFVKGWVLAAADAKVTAGDPLQVSVKATDTDILIVMYVGKGDVPTATVKDGAVTVAGKTISLDTAAGKIVCK
jgi:hypothetical protein